MKHKIIQPAAFTRLYNILKRQHDEHMNTRRQCEIGGNEWNAITAVANRKMSGMMEIETGDRPNFLKQTAAQISVARKNKNCVSVRVRHFDAGCYSFDFVGSFDLRDKYVLQMLRRDALEKMRQHGFYFI